MPRIMQMYYTWADDKMWESKTCSIWSILFPQFIRAGTTSFIVVSTTLPDGSQANWNIISSTYSETRVTCWRTKKKKLLIFMCSFVRHHVLIRKNAPFPRSQSLHCTKLWSQISSPWLPRSIFSEADLEIFVCIWEECQQQSQIMSCSLPHNCSRILNELLHNGQDEGITYLRSHKFSKLTTWLSNKQSTLLIHVINLQTSKPPVK